jgi:hypothetical protein
MATKNIVPRAHEEGNIGTSLKNWLKGWFKDLFISGNLTNGSNNISIADLQDIIDNDHNHTNKLILDDITDSGLGTKFLSDDGTYKTALGTGDMLKVEYDINLNNIVDKAEALNDGTTGGGNNVTAEEAREHIDDTSNPHSVTKAQLGFLEAPSDIGCGTGITASDIDDAVTKKHTQNTDAYLDFGGINQLQVTDIVRKSGSLSQLTTRNHADLQNKNTETNIKHVTDNQKDALDNANSPASGNPILTRNNFPYAEASSEGNSSTNDTNPVEKLKLTTGILPAGNYRIAWSVEIYTTNRANPVVFRVQLDDTTILGEGSSSPQTVIAGEYSNQSGFKYTALTNASHTIDIDFYVGVAGVSVSIRRARLEIWRTK